MKKLLSISAIVLISTLVQAGNPDYNLKGYVAQPGLTAEVEEDLLVVTWDAGMGNQFRCRFGILDSVPVIQDLSSRVAEEWIQIAGDLTPEFRVVSGMRRVTQQQTEPLVEMGVKLTKEVLNEIKWDAFWDAPLYVSDEPPMSHQSSIPASDPFANHPGMPRKQEEIVRSTATYRTTGCEVHTRGARLEIIFPGVKAGIFSGYLQFDIYRGTGLIRQMLVASTDFPSAAFKYDAGLKGLSSKGSSRLVWRDLADQLQDYRPGGPVSLAPTIIKSRFRLLAAEQSYGSIAAFPPPHSFYWARESEENLGYSWFRRDPGNRFSFGVRQAELEENPEYYHNFALYSARPGTRQRMPVFYLITTTKGEEAIEGALEFTNRDRYRPLPGYKVMGHHYHVGMMQRLAEQGGPDQLLNDVETMKGIGMDIYSIIDGVRGAARHDRGEAYLDALSAYYDAARRQSDEEFLLMPNDENSTGGRPPFLGGHYDILISKPLFWRPGREPGQPLYEEHPRYGTVYNLGEPDDLMAMTEREDVLVSLPHPNTKRSTGYPEAFKDEPHFLHENYFSLGYRWGMGIDASELRLGEYRFLNLWDRVNNWMVEWDYPLKYALAISEARSDKGQRGKPPWDDPYGMAPVNYLQIDRVPAVDDMSPVIQALKQGKYFVTTGEVLIPFYEVRGSGRERLIIADVEWTFPLDFVEVIWGDGTTTGTEIIPAADLPPFGSKRFEIPFDATGKKWIRFAAWDVAINGAMVQPVRLKDPLVKP